jgi:hypothetical protein
MDVWIYIRPAIDPADRGDIEDALGDALGDRGEVFGGGTMLDGSECDISLELFDDNTPVRPAVEEIRVVLRTFEFARPTEIAIKVGDETFGLWDA